MRLCWPSISVGNQVSVCSLCRMKHLRGCWGGYIPCERVYLLIHVTHFGVATIHRTFGVCLLIIWPHGFSVLFYMSDCSHWKQIVYTLEIQGIHQPISEKSIGYKPCMMSARTYASTVMQGAGLSVSKWLDHRGMKMMRYHTRYFCTAWLIVYVNSNLAWCLRELMRPRSGKGHEMRYYILEVVEEELLASLHLSGVSTCTFQGRTEESSPHITGGLVT